MKNDHAIVSYCTASLETAFSDIPVGLVDDTTIHGIAQTIGENMIIDGFAPADMYELESLVRELMESSPGILQESLG